MPRPSAHRHRSKRKSHIRCPCCGDPLVPLKAVWHDRVKFRTDKSSD